MGLLVSWWSEVESDGRDTGQWTRGRSGKVIRCVVIKGGRGEIHILAKSSPGCEMLAEEGSIVLVFVDSLQGIEDRNVSLPILFSIELGGASDAT